MFDKLVSVVIPTFGRPDNIEKAINSVLNQSYKAIEIIVVDDNGRGTGNQIKTDRKLAQYVTADRIKYIVSESNLGGGLARNLGIESASGEYITFLDDDDIYLKDKVFKQVDAFSNLPSDIDMVVIGTELNFGGNECTTQYPQGRTAKEFILGGVIMTPMMMLKKDVFNKGLKFLDISRMQDHTFVLNFISLDLKYIILEDVGYIHNIHDEIRITNSAHKNSIIDKLEALELSLIDKLRLTDKDIKSIQLKNDILRLENEINKVDYKLSLKYIYQACIIVFRSFLGNKFLVSIRLFIRTLVGNNFYWNLRRFGLSIFR